MSLLVDVKYREMIGDWRLEIFDLRNGISNLPAGQAGFKGLLSSAVFPALPEGRLLSFLKKGIIG